MSEATPVTVAVIQVQGLSYSYGEGRGVLSDIEFNVAEGERVGLARPAGPDKADSLALCDVEFNI